LATSHDSPIGGERDGRDTEDLGADEITRADTQWAVPREYQVELGPASAEATDHDHRVLAPPGHRRASRARVPTSDLAAGLVLLLVVALGAGAWFVTQSGESSASPASIETVTSSKPKATDAKKQQIAAAKHTRPARVPTPAVAGRTVGVAKAALHRAGLRVRIRTTASPRPAGVVLRQAPAASSGVPPKATVALLVSSGPHPASVPDVVGAEARFAARRLRDAGLRVQVVHVPANDGAGTVVSESPAAGARMSRGGMVRLTVAKPAPKPPVTTLAVPRLVGLGVGSARSLLERMGLRVAIVQAQSDRPRGEVIRQSPGAGARVRKRGDVELVVSRGPILLTVPEVTGFDEDTARTELEQAGFTVSVVDDPTSDPSQDGIVSDESPASGSQAKQGATITITVERYSG